MPPKLVECTEYSFLCFTPTPPSLNFVTFPKSQALVLSPSAHDLRSRQVPLRLIQSGILSINTVFQVTILGQDRWVAQSKGDSGTLTGQARLVLRLLQN